MEHHAEFASELQYLSTVQLAGYRMYSLDTHPYVVHSGSADDVIVAELYCVTSPHTEQMIRDREIGAGYILSSLTIGDETFGLFLFAENSPRDVQIIDGDWVRYAAAASF